MTHKPVTDSSMGHGDEWIAAYTRALERSRSTGDDVELLEASNRIVRQIVDLLATRMGERLDGRSLTRDVYSLRDALPAHPDVYPTGSSAGSAKAQLDRLYRATYWLEQTEGADGGISMPEGAHYRDLQHLALDLLNAASSIVQSLATDEPELDPVEFEGAKTVVLRSLARGAAANATMGRLLSELAEAHPHPQWTLFSDLDIGPEVERRKGWLLELFPSRLPGATPEGFGFVIFTPLPAGRATYDVEVEGSRVYDPNLYEWPADTVPAPSAPMRSETLGQIYALANRTPSFPSGGRVIALAYALIVGRELALEFKRVRGLGRIGLCAGFSEDTPLHLGWI